MKKDKKQIRSALLEALLELVLTVVCFGIGALIVHLFGVDLDSPNVDFELMILIGIVVPIAFFAIVFALVQWSKKMIKGKHP